MKGFKESYLNLALTVSYVPYFPDSGYQDRNCLLVVLVLSREGLVDFSLAHNLDQIDGLRKSKLPPFSQPLNVVCHITLVFDEKISPPTDKMTQKGTILCFIFRFPDLFSIYSRID